MSSKVVPFYQRRHKHYDHSYRNLQSKYVVQEYSTQKRSHSASTQKVSSISSGSRVRCICGADRDVQEYYAPAFKKRTHEQKTEQHSQQQVEHRSQHQHRSYDRSLHYTTELAFLEEDIRIARALAREQIDKVSIQRMVEEKMALQRQIHEDCISRAPDLLVRLRSHTVWEGMPVKLFFTVQGYPTPLVQWYKNETLITPASEPGKYRVESRYGVNSLEIYRTTINDTATYTAVARNVHGQSTTNSAVIVKRFRSEDEPLYPGFRPQLPLTAAVCFTHIEVKFLETFGVRFGVEGETVTLSCSVVLTPELSRLRPQPEWYRDDAPIKESKWHQLHFGEGRATLTLTHLNKDDEGLYTLRMVTRAGVNQHSGFLFVADAAALILGAPGAPMDVECCDANKDYVIVTWKPPNTASEAPVIGYFVDKCEVGTENWIQCNDSPVKICKYPVTGLFEGRSYLFRVRAVNKAGISRPSRISVAVAALDPADLSRLQTIHLDGGRDIVICQDDLEGDVKIPGSPTNVQALETSKTYVVLSWDPPVPRGRDPLVYYIEKTMVGSGSWQRINSDIPVRSPRYAVFDLVEGKSYNFRVIAVNKHGVSEASEVTPPIQAQERLAVPSAPGRILATRNTRTSVLVQFDKPKVEEELIGYYIDSSVVGSNHWDHCNHKPIKYNRFVVHGLTTGEQYIFRVKAVNAVGVSENSQESEAITVKAALRGGIPHATPSHPYGVTLLNCDGQSMTIGWKLPKFTGGANITGYYIDKREADHLNWHEVNSKQVSERIFKVEDLKEGAFYEYKITACNLAGLGLPSDPSDHFLCEAWTSPEPGPAYDLTFCEVRNTSLVILWKAPIYSGNSPVVGYFVEYREMDGELWTRVNETATANRYLKVKELEEGKTYVFQIRAVNVSGIGKPSDISEPVLVQARPGVQEITTGVDEEGNIYLAYNCTEISEASQFSWCKAYEEITEDQKFKIETIGENSKVYFKDPDKDDLGTYSVAVSDTDGISSSYVLDADELERLMALSHEIRNPTIPLKSELAYEILEKGRVRFWMEAINLSADASFRFVANDMEVKDSESHRIKFDRATGTIEMIMDTFTVENEGTYTVQIQDGKAKNQSSLVLIGDAFKALLAEADFQRKEYIRKQGPHFLEYLYWDVTEECEVLLVCKVANTKKETVFKWYKAEIPVEAVDVPDLQQGMCIFRIPKLTKKDQGEYKATLKDDRGQDVSILELSGKVYEDIVLGMSKVSGLSASELRINCTPEGIRFHCYMKYFSEEMKVAWYQRDSKISSSDKMRIGGTDEFAWLQICEPTEKDKGKYTFEIFDAKTSYKRNVDLSGQAFDEAYAEFQRLKAAAFAEKNRGKVIGGLPDVVTIMEGKTLSLTCTVFGSPDPEVTWLKNDRDLEMIDHYSSTLEQGKYASLTIRDVSSEDSGKYGINVKNKYGGETVDVTVSVYKYGEDIPEVKPGQLPKTAPSPAPAPAKAPAPAPAPAPEKAKSASKAGKSGRK